jgi:hypothetical protein
MFKLYITKGFTTVDWAFFLNVLANKIGFGEQFLIWICTMLSSVTTNELLNGVPRGLTDNKQGASPGDPL